MNLHLDYETRSTADLKKVGAHAYAEHPSTEILCAAYAVDDSPVGTWWPGKYPDPLRDPLAVHMRAADTITAHNAAFERLITNGCGQRYGLPKIAVEKMRCTMVMAYALGLPGSLDDACAAVALDIRKDAQGKRIMLKMSKPRKPRKGEPTTVTLWHETPADHERLRAYCAQDVEAERALEKRLLPLSKPELDLWFLDQRINDRGLCVDVDLAEGAVAIVDHITADLNKRIIKASDFEVRGITDRTNIVAFAKAQGFSDIDSISKDNLARILIREDLTPALREVLELRQEGAKASVAKVDALLNSRCVDGRGRGFLQFHAANTGRWGGRRFQPQNLKRPQTSKKFIPGIIESVRRGVWSEVDELFYGPPLSAIGDIVRGMVQAEGGHKLTAADYSNIEGRVLAWLAGETWKLDAFRKFDAKTGHDLYILAYARSFGVPFADVNDFMRQIGKVMELALGYQGGVGAFLAMAKGYGLEVSDFYDVIRDNAPETFAEAAESYAFRGRASGTGERTWVPAETLKLLWREANPAIVQFWNDIEDAAILAVERPGSKVNCGPLVFLKRGSFLFLRRPGGTPMAYPYPEVRDVPYFGKTKPALTFKTVPDPLKPAKIIPEADGSVNMRWARISTYGGMLAENATQAVARDILANGMVNLDRAGWPIVLHVHDEIVAEQDGGDVDKFVGLMTTLPQCYDGLPITAAGFQAERYKK